MTISLGQVVSTAGVADWMNGSISLHAAVCGCIERHRGGDWGEVCQEDRNANDAAARDGERLLSAYTVGSRKIWIITEWDRSVTTVLFPDEY